jgi:hypothetical protein
MTTFPSLILEINQFTFAFGPTLPGWTRGWWGSNSVALVLASCFRLRPR